MAVKFEEALKELEGIALRLENGDCTLDESIELYEKAMKLTKECNEIIEKAKIKITELKNGDADD